jgi:hypothetical protein
MFPDRRVRWRRRPEINAAILDLCKERGDATYRPAAAAVAAVRRGQYPIDGTPK